MRRLSEIKLWEISLITFPMNRAAQVRGVKTVDDFAKELEDFAGRCRSAAGVLGGEMARFSYFLVTYW